MTFCRSDQYKTFHTRVQTFEFIRSTKEGHQLNIQKHDLRESQNCKIDQPSGPGPTSVTTSVLVLVCVIGG